MRVCKYYAISYYLNLNCAAVLHKYQPRVYLHVHNSGGKFTRRPTWQMNDMDWCFYKSCPSSPPSQSFSPPHLYWWVPTAVHINWESICDCVLKDSNRFPFSLISVLLLCIPFCWHTLTIASSPARYHGGVLNHSTTIHWNSIPTPPITQFL